MPLYDYVCQSCDKVVELNVPYEKRDARRKHKGCGGKLKREWLKPPTDGSAAYEMQAVMYKGEQKVTHMKGHFGKEAPRRRKSK